jgi:hypothetical protein
MTGRRSTQDALRRISSQTHIEKIIQIINSCNPSLFGDQLHALKHGSQLDKLHAALEYWRLKTGIHKEEELYQFFHLTKLAYSSKFIWVLAYEDMCRCTYNRMCFNYSDYIDGVSLYKIRLYLKHCTPAGRREKRSQMIPKGGCTLPVLPDDVVTLIASFVFQKRLGAEIHATTKLGRAMQRLKATEGCTIYQQAKITGRHTESEGQVWRLHSVISRTTQRLLPFLGHVERYGIRRLQKYPHVLKKSTCVELSYDATLRHPT